MARKRKKIKIVLRPLGKEKAWGLSFNGENRIDLDERCRPKFFMILGLHEGLHQLENSWTESKVDKSATILANILWSLGFRRVYDENKPMKPKLKSKKKKS